VQVAGVSLADGLFLEETARLLDATDRRCAEQMQALRDVGHRGSISAVVRATYTGFRYSDERELRKLPASVVLNACEHGRFWHRPPMRPMSPARSMWEAAPRPRWGRLAATLLLLNTDRSDDTKLLPDVFSAAWAANGYHLRLMALRTAHEAAQASDDTTRDQMRAALEECDTANVFINGFLFEALAAYGGIEPLNSEESIRAEVHSILATPENPDAWDSAFGVTTKIFEDQQLHGPYADVLADLEPVDYLRLHVMAARSERLIANLDWIMNAIVEHLDIADDDARNVLRNGVLIMDWASPFRQETVGAHLIALRGWAALADELPPAPDTTGDIAQRAWRIVDELLFALFRRADAEDTEMLAFWEELLNHCAPAAVDVIAHLRSHPLEYNSTGPSTYQRLLTTWPDQRP